MIAQIIGKSVEPQGNIVLVAAHKYLRSFVFQSLANADEIISRLNDGLVDRSLSLHHQFASGVTSTATWS